MQESGFIKISSWKCLNYLKATSTSFSRAQSASFLISTLNSFQGYWRSAALVANLCRDRWQVPISNWQSPFSVMNLTMVWGHYMTFSFHSARNCTFFPRSCENFVDRPLIKWWYTVPHKINDYNSGALDMGKNNKRKIFSWPTRD